jgi:hypothetical protein
VHLVAGARFLAMPVEMAHHKALSALPAEVAAVEQHL